MVINSLPSMAAENDPRCTVDNSGVRHGDKESHYQGW